MINVMENKCMKMCFITDAINTVFYIMHKGLIRPILNKTPMSFILEEGQIFFTFMSLDVNVMLITMANTT